MHTILFSAPYMIPFVDRFRPFFNHYGIRLILPEVTERLEVEFPIGHRKRRDEGIPVLVKKFESSLRDKLPAESFESLKDLCSKQADLEATTVDAFMAMLVTS